MLSNLAKTQHVAKMTNVQHNPFGVETLMEIMWPLMFIQDNRYGIFKMLMIEVCQELDVHTVHTYMYIISLIYILFH